VDNRHPERRAVTHRSDVARRECTRDPIFLLQYAYFLVADPAGFDSLAEISDDGEYSSSDILRLVKEGLLALEWTTESVWLDREEAEASRKAHEYRWRYGSRVYCVCAGGRLAELLKAADRWHQPLGVEPDREWLAKMAAAEDRCDSISVGGLAVEAGLYHAPKEQEDGDGSNDERAGGGVEGGGQGGSRGPQDGAAGPG
jgi:hypothetical protein